MKKSFQFTLVILSFISLSTFAQQVNFDSEKYKIDAFIRMVNDNYVDTVDNHKLVEEAIVAMLEQLDPHSVYIPKEELQRMNEPLIGNFEGIGIQFNVLRDTIVVVSPISGGPSEKLGILSGDKIIKIEDSIVAGRGIKNIDVMHKLRGRKGTKVNVSILRYGQSDLLDFTIIRDKIPLLSVDATYMVTPEIGYIKVNRFAQKTHEEFVEGLNDLDKQGMKHLILDLRGNGGGYLETAFRMADEFLDKNKMIVYTKGLKHKQHEFKSTDRGVFKKGKLVILMDEGSASASEIVAGAVQDWDRGLIIGRKSFGKGLVQKPYGLPDGSQVRLTTARYYTPSGRCIQKPYTTGKESYHKEILNRLESGELFSSDSINFPDSLKYLTNAKRTVFGGGGIMPDIFMPLDTSQYTDYYSNLLRKGMFSKFILTYLDHHRTELSNKYSNFYKYKKEFQVDEEIIQKFKNFTAENGIEMNEEQFTTSKELISRQLRALLADNLWSNNEYYQIWNEENLTFKKAVESIEGNAFNRSRLSYR